MQLPQVRYEPTTTKPENVSLSVRSQGDTCQVYWLMEKVTQKQLLDKAVKKLEDQIKAVGGVQNITEDNMPEAHIRGDINTQYKCIGATISRCRKRVSSGSGSFPSRRRNARSAVSQE